MYCVDLPYRQYNNIMMMIRVRRHNGYDDDFPPST